MKFYRLVLGILTVWRITHFLQAEDGPLEIVVSLRRRAGEGFWGKLLDCFYCLSIWVAMPFALFTGEGWRERVLLWPSLSAGAILLERITHLGVGVPPKLWTEDRTKEKNHGVLWTEETTGDEPCDTDSPAR